LSNSGVRELEINFPPTHVTCVFYVAVQSKILLSHICLFFLYCCSFLFKKKKKKKKIQCLPVSPLETKQTIFSNGFLLHFHARKKKSFFFFFDICGFILCLLVQFCAILAVRACAILSLWVPVTECGCWDMRQPIGVSPVEFVSDRLWLCCVAYILVRILKESVGILWWFRQF
jgi:hypothetical protein